MAGLVWPTLSQQISSCFFFNHSASVHMFFFDGLWVYAFLELLVFFGVLDNKKQAHGGSLRKSFHTFYVRRYSLQNGTQREAHLVWEVLLFRFHIRFNYYISLLFGIILYLLNAWTNVLRLIDFTRARNMVVCSTLYQHKQIHPASWLSPDRKTERSYCDIQKTCHQCS